MIDTNETFEMKGKRNSEKLFTATVKGFDNS